MYRILLILFSPIFLLFALVYLLAYGLSRAPFIGGILALVLMLIILPIYPVMMIYAAEFIHWGKQKLCFDSTGIQVESWIFRKQVVSWTEIVCLRRYFQGPFHEHRLELADGSMFNLNSFTELSELKVELQSRNIAYFDQMFGVTGDAFKD